jgi:hypothetical protein
MAPATSGNGPPQETRKSVYHPLAERIAIRLTGDYSFLEAGDDEKEKKKEKEITPTNTTTKRRHSETPLGTTTDTKR